MKGRALRRACGTNAIERLSADLPAITDETELITPDRAYALLECNQLNRPIKWHRVEELAAIMRRGHWKLHGQGIMLDTRNNLLTGQHRLWAVIYADTAVYMRISRNNPPDVGSVIDRGVPQSARDLAARQTGVKHAAIESSLARATLALDGIVKPSTDVLSMRIAEQKSLVLPFLESTRGTKKTRAILFMLGAMLRSNQPFDHLVTNVELYAAEFTTKLLPQTPEQCWGRGAAFRFAMQTAVSIIKAAS